MQDRGLVGVWRLRSMHAEIVGTDERIEMFGPQPNGVLILHADGRMAAIVTPRDRPPPATEADRAAAFERMIAYSGRYRLEPPDRFVTTVDVAWFAPWIGTEQARTFRLDGDRLDIVTAPTTPPATGGRLAIGVLAWVREAAAG